MGSGGAKRLGDALKSPFGMALQVTKGGNFLKERGGGWGGLLY